MKGIVIKTQDYGETHKIVTIFSSNIGKITTIARGAKKTKSKLAAVTQPFIYGDFLIYISSGLSTIRQGEIINSLRPIREDIVKTAYAAYIVELTDKIMENKIPDFYIYNQLLQTLHWIANNTEVEIPVMMYEFKLFERGGFAPVIHQCVNCNKKNELSSFSITEGGLLCKNCFNLDGSAIILSPSLIRLLHIFKNIEVERIGNISVKKKNLLLLRNILNAYYDQYGSYYIKSRNFLQQLDLLK